MRANSGKVTTGFPPLPRVKRVIEDDLISAAKFALSVMKEQGLFDLSERMAHERLSAAVKRAEAAK